MISVFLALVAASSVSAFEIASSSSSPVKVKEGEDIELWCKSDNYWEWCKITHVATDTSCEHVWNKTPYTVKVGDCGDFEGRMEYIGDKGASVYKCGVRIKNVRPEEAGDWKCDITEYYDGTNKWQSYADTASKSFTVDVEIKTTTTTTTTTTSKPVTTDYVYEYPEADEVDEDTEDGAADGSGTNNAQTGNKNKKKRDSGFSMTYVIIIVVAVIVVCVLIILGALHYKKKLPTFGGAGKNFKPVDQNETAQSGLDATAVGAADDPEEEAKHPSIVKANGSSNGVSPTKEAADKPDEAEINPELTKVTWTSEKDEAAKADEAGEDKPLKGVDED